MKLTIPAYRTDAELHAKIKSVSMRLPTELLRAVRAEADAERALHPGSIGRGGGGEEAGVRDPGD